MSSASNYLEGRVLDHVLRNTAFTQPAALYVALFTGAAGVTDLQLEAGTLTNEVPSGRGYARKAISFSAASGGTAANSGIVTFDPSTVAWGTITYVAITDSATIGAGNVLFWGAVTTPKTIDIGDTFQISVGNLTVSMS